MTTRLKIDLSQGILEVEGSETFVKAIYSDFKLHFVEPDDQTVTESPLTTKPRRVRTARRAKASSKAAPSAPEAPEVVETPPPPEIVALPEPEPTPPPEPEPKAAAPVVPTYTYLADLKLGAAKGRQSLVEFMDTKLPITNEERNLVFLYYLQHTLKVKPITQDHVYTCYREAKIRAPLNIENSLRMTADHRGWIKAGPNGSLTVTADGKQYVEKQLPKKSKVER